MQAGDPPQPGQLHPTSHAMEGRHMLLSPGQRLWFDDPLPMGNGSSAMT
jgi:hypothetical protein